MKFFYRQPRQQPENVPDAGSATTAPIADAAARLSTSRWIPADARSGATAATKLRYEWWPAPTCHHATAK